MLQIDDRLAAVAGRPAAVLVLFLARTHARLDVSWRYIAVLYVLCIELAFRLLHTFRSMFSFAIETSTSRLSVPSGPAAVRPSSTSNATVLRKGDDAMNVDLEAGVLLFPGEVADAKQRLVRQKMWVSPLPPLLL
jgi:hypothetical protein